MSARDDGITGEVLDKFEPLPPDTGPHCTLCGRFLVTEMAFVDAHGELQCVPCLGVSDAEEESYLDSQLANQPGDEE